MFKRAIAFLSLTFFAVSAFAAPVGINLAAPRDLHDAEAFVNIFKLSEGWFTSCRYDWNWNNGPGEEKGKAIDPGCRKDIAFNSDEGGKLIYDHNGWVRGFNHSQSPIATYLTRSIKFPSHYRGGRFILDYAGQATVKVIGGSVRIVSQKPGRIEYDYNPPQNSTNVYYTSIKIEISNINYNNYIRDIRLYRHEHRGLIGHQTFTNEYVNRLRQFQLIRYMPWANMRENETVNWHDVITRGHHTYIGEQGVPEELMVELANMTGTDMWINLPHKVSDEYMRQRAWYTKQKFHGTVYLEYSNEVWNNIFPAHHWAKHHKGGAVNFYAKRSVDMCRIWKSVFGNEAYRIKCVLSSYVGSEYLSRQTLDCPAYRAEMGGRTCASEMDLFGVGPYFGHYIGKLEHRNTYRSWARSGQHGLNNLFHELFHGGLIRKKDGSPEAPKGGIDITVQEINRAANLAHEFGVGLIAYEGGQQIVRLDNENKINVNRDADIINFIVRANQDHRMQQAYDRYLRAWYSATGGEPMLHFSGLMNGGPLPFFGIFDPGHHTSPKWRALQQYMAW